MQSLSHFEKLFFGESVDEQSENVLDHIIRKLLLHRSHQYRTVPTEEPELPSKFDYSWSDRDFLNKLYDDRTFPKMVQTMYATVITQCFKTTTSISQKITLTKSRNDHEYDLIAWNQYVHLLSSIDQKNLSFQDKEMFVWSFCVIIAMKIKYLELNVLVTTKEGTQYRSGGLPDKHFHFRCLEALIQKFVLELSEPSAARCLWPWHDNLLHDLHEDLNEMKQILHHNGEYILKSKKDIEYDSLTPYSLKSFNYPNIRYMRKCAANLLLDERLTAKQLFELHKITSPSIGSPASAKSHISAVPSTSAPVRILPSISNSESIGIEDDDDEPLTSEESNTFRSVLNTIFKDRMDDIKTVELRKMMEIAIMNKDIKPMGKKTPKLTFAKGVPQSALSLSDMEPVPEHKDEEKKEDEDDDGAAFVVFRSYFSQLPKQFNTKMPLIKQKKESTPYNKYDLLLLRLGIGYGFDLKKIKKLLYYHKTYVSWEFRQFFKEKIRVLIRMKYLCTLVLGNSSKQSYFKKRIISSKSVIFCDGCERQQHLLYCARFEQYDPYHSVGTPSIVTPQPVQLESIEMEAMKKAAESIEKQPALRDKIENEMTVIVKSIDEDVLSPDITQTPGITPGSPLVRIHHQSTAISSGDKARLVVHRQRSSFDLGDDNLFEEVSLRVVEERNIQQEIRDSIHFYGKYELQDDIVQYIINKIRLKTDHRVVESLWKVLIIILTQLPLGAALRLLSKHWDAIRNKEISNVKFIKSTVDALIQCNATPIATALFLSAWLEERAAGDITRRDAWLELAHQCEEIAQNELEKINSDHVLCLLLYAPTDIHLMSTLDIAIRYNRVTFLHHPYISGVLQNTWSNGNPMMADPLIPGSLFSLEAGDLVVSIWRNPTQFIYSAFGLALLYCILYLVFLGVITWYATMDNCVNLHLRAERPTNRIAMLEVLILVVVLSIIWSEVSEFLRDRKVYFTKISNSFDFVANVMWIIIIVMKFWSRICGFISSTQGTCEIDSSGMCLSLYYSLWGVVMIFMFMKITVIFQYTTLMGRFLKTMSLLVHDIFTFLVTASVFFLGFVFCLYILGNADTASTGTEIETLFGSSRILYDAFFTLSGPFELQWDDAFNDRYNKYLMNGLLILYQVLAAILLLNLLIAMMSDTYRNVFLQAVAETNFYKIEQTTSCMQPYGRLIGAFAFFIFILCCILNAIIVFFQFLLYLCTRSRWLFDVNRFETWQWMYDDFWSQYVLCYCCCGNTALIDGKHTDEFSRGGDVYDYTVSELRLSEGKIEKKQDEALLYQCKLYDIAQYLVKVMLIENDFKVGDVKHNDRRRCCFCCVKQRRKSRKMNDELMRMDHMRKVTEKQRLHLRVKSRLHTSKLSSSITPISGKLKDESNLLYDPNEDDDEKSYLNKKTQQIQFDHDYSVDDKPDKVKKVKLVRYTTNDKMVCREKVRRHRRLNRVRADFEKSKTTGMMFNLKRWYNEWQFVDNETFCVNCFIGSPSNSIEEYGTIEKFIKTIQKRFEYVIKRSDRMALRRALKDSILCQRCFYPLHINTFHDERKSRFQIMVEITSTYFFYLFAWIPMLIILIPFGLIGWIRNKSQEYGSAQSLLWNIEEIKNFHDEHGLLLPHQRKHQIAKSSDLYQNQFTVNFDDE